MDINTAKEFLSKDLDMMIVETPRGLLMDGDLYTEDELIESAEEQLEVMSAYECVSPEVYLAGVNGKCYFSYSMALVMFQDHGVPFEEHERPCLCADDDDPDWVKVFGMVYFKPHFLEFAKKLLTLLAKEEGTSFQRLVKTCWKRRA